MRLDELTMLNTLSGAMRFHAERTKVLAQNVANAQTPDFVPRDIAHGDVGAALSAASVTGTRHDAGVGLVRTHGAHVSDPAAGAARFTTQLSPDSQTNLNGNAVVIEEQMMKVSETRLAYETAVGLYNKTITMMRSALRSPSG